MQGSRTRKCFLWVSVSNSMDNQVLWKNYYNAVTTSNQACRHMEKCNYERSVELFTKAIFFCKQGRCKDTRVLRDGEGKLLSVDDLMERSTPRSQQQAGDGVAIYNQPIRMPPVNTDPVGFDEFAELQSLLKCFPSILFFNLALAYHLLGIEMEQQRFLRKAIVLYESSFRYERIRLRKAFVSHFLLAAILNNLGHIYGITKQRKEAESHFLKLFSMLVYLVQKKRVNRAEYSPFFENSAIGLSRSIFCCAAAA